MSLAMPDRWTAPAADPPRLPHTAARDQRLVIAMIALATMALLACSSARHLLLRSGAFDLGFFDQTVYLISKGQAPISSLHGFHVLADHASVILYPLALLYLVWPDPHMLLGAQASALAGGAWAVWKLSQGAGLARGQALGLTAAYLSFPLVLTANLFDFHPDVFVVLALLLAVLAARQSRPVAFCVWVAIALSCKEILSLTVAAMGLWLLLFERKQFYGLVALVSGALWFVVSTKLLIPYFGNGRLPSGAEHYLYLGTGPWQMMVTAVTDPQVVLARLLSTGAVKYLTLILVPLAWGLHWRTAAPLLAAAPAILLNLLSDNASQRSPFYQYSLPIVPFLFIAAIGALSSQRGWLSRGRAIVLWSVSMLAAGLVARLGRVNTDHTMDWQALQGTRQAIHHVESDADVLTTFELVPQLSNRQTVHFVGGFTSLPNLEDYECVLLNLRHSSLEAHDDHVAELVETLSESGQFQLAMFAPDVLMFSRSQVGAASPVAKLD
jgi:uncharacterized membrane protein